VPQDMADAVPEAEGVFLPYQQRWFDDTSQIMIAEKSRRTGLTWAEAGRNVINAAKPGAVAGAIPSTWAASRRWRWRSPTAHREAETAKAHRG